MRDYKNKKVYIILVNYNGWQDTIECLESLFKIEYRNYQILLVDNDSPNNSIENIKSWANGKTKINEKHTSIFKKYVLPYIKKPIEYIEYTALQAIQGGDRELEKRYKDPLILIKSDKNGGFSYGNNIAINYALKKNDFDYVLLLNNDTIVDKLFLQEMVKTAENYQNAGIVGSKIYYYDKPNKLWFNGGTFNEWIGRSSHIQKENKTDISECSFITGCSMLIQKDVLEKVGLLDESYFMYVEDLDYSYRTTKYGYKLFVAHNSIIWHKIGASNEGELSEFSAYWSTKNRIKLILKNNNFIKIIISLSILFITRIIKFNEYSLKGYKNIKLAQIKAIKDSFKM